MSNPLKHLTQLFRGAASELDDTAEKPKRKRRLNPFRRAIPEPDSEPEGKPVAIIPEPATLFHAAVAAGLDAHVAGIIHRANPHISAPDFSRVIDRAKGILDVHAASQRMLTALAPEQRKQFERNAMLASGTEPATFSSLIFTAVAEAEEEIVIDTVPPPAAKTPIDSWKSTIAKFNARA